MFYSIIGSFSAPLLSNFSLNCFITVHYLTPDVWWMYLNVKKKKCKSLKCYDTEYLAVLWLLRDNDTSAVPH